MLTFGGVLSSGKNIHPRSLGYQVAQPDAFKLKSRGQLVEKKVFTVPERLLGKAGSTCRVASGSSVVTGKAPERTVCPEDTQPDWHCQ
jgi:hypothetical protein